MTAADEALYSRKTTHTFLDFGATNGMYTANDTGHQFAGDISQLLDGGVLSETFKISRGSNNYFMVLFASSASSWSGLQIQVNSSGQLTFNVPYADLSDGNTAAYFDTLDNTSFNGKEFELSLAFEKADTDGNGSKDLIVRIYINGERFKGSDSSFKLCNNGILTIPGGYDKIVNGQDGANQFLNIYPQGGKAMIKSLRRMF